MRYYITDEQLKIIEDELGNVPYKVAVLGLQKTMQIFTAVVTSQQMNEDDSGGVRK